MQTGYHPCNKYRFIPDIPLIVELQTTIMKKNALIFLFILAVLPLAAQTGSKNFIDKPYISVTGYAEMKVDPDMIFLKVILDEKNNKEPVARQEQSLIAILKSCGLDPEKDLRVVDYNSNFKNYFPVKKDIQLSKQYEVLAHDAMTVNKLFQLLEKAGISQVSIEKLDHTQILDFRKEVRVAAIRAAKEKAIYLAEAIGQEIGKAIYIEESEIFPYVNSRSSNALLSQDFEFRIIPDDADEPTVEFEKIKITASFDCKFELH